MAKLNIPPTKSNYHLLKQQLDYAREGYDLLEEKRQILIMELMRRLSRARESGDRMAESLSRAFAALREATLDLGSEGVEKAALAISPEPYLKISNQHLVGLRIPRVEMMHLEISVQFSIGGTSSTLDLAMIRFVEMLPQLTEFAELENAVLRLARELRKTQRRCNALSKILIPSYTQTLAFIADTMEERERESFIILKMIRDRLDLSLQHG